MTQKIFDVHAHIFPEKIAEKAVRAIGDFYGIRMTQDGSVQTLIESGSKIGIKKYVVHSTATAGNQVCSINDFVARTVRQNAGTLIGFGTTHLDYEDFVGEVDRIIELGLNGIKLHPDFQQFNADDPRMYPVYEAATGRLPILFHAGDNRFDFSSPLRIAKVAKDFPGLKIIAAHLGGYRRWHQSSAYKGLDNVFFDTCSSLFMFTPHDAVRHIRSLGIDRVMFGTDYPMWKHTDEYECIMRLDLTPSEREGIFYKNAENILGIG